MGAQGESACEPDAGPALRPGPRGRGRALVVELGTGDGVMTGESPAASPASMSVLATPFRSGMGPSASAGSGGGCRPGLALLEWAAAWARAGAAGVGTRAGVTGAGTAAAGAGARGDVGVK